MKILALFFLSFGLFACLPDSGARYDAGYNDGYATGYNTECKIRTTLVEGDWSDKNYTSGFNDGKLDGAKACRNQSR